MHAQSATCDDIVAWMPSGSTLTANERARTRITAGTSGLVLLDRLPGRKMSAEIER